MGYMSRNRFTILVLAVALVVALTNGLTAPPRGQVQGQSTTPVLVLNRHAHEAIPVNQIKNLFRAHQQIGTGAPMLVRATSGDLVITDIVAVLGEASSGLTLSIDPTGEVVIELPAYSGIKPSSPVVIPLNSGILVRNGQSLRIVSSRASVTVTGFKL